jgi:hypothetical protein
MEVHPEGAEHRQFATPRRAPGPAPSSVLDLARRAVDAGMVAERYLLPTRVECYAGGRADEVPRALWVDGERQVVTEVVDRWYQASPDRAATTFEYFRVQTSDGRLHLLRHEMVGTVWYLVEPLGRTRRSLS